MSSVKYYVGFLIILLTSTAVYITLIPDLKIRIDDDRSSFYTLEDSRWKVSGREYNYLFDGTSKMNRRPQKINVITTIDEILNTTTIVRTTPYIRGPVIVDTYFFDGKVDDKELFPISHKVEIFNGTGYFYRYEVRDLVYNGETKKLSGTEMSFGRNMKVNWQEGFRWAWVYKTGILKVQYNINSDYEVYNVRLFDPIVGYNLPNSTGSPSNDWVDGDNIKLDDSLYADGTATGDLLDTANYSFLSNRSAFDIIVHGIEVRVNGYSLGSCSKFIKAVAAINITLSWDGGSTYTTDLKSSSFSCDNSPTFPPPDQIKTFGDLTDDWGHTWTSSSELNNTNLRVRLGEMAGENFGHPAIDYIEVRINYTEVLGNGPTVLLLSPANETTDVVSPAELNYSVIDSENNLLDIILRGTDDLTYMNESFITHSVDVESGNFTKDWTIVPVNKGTWGLDLWALYHLNTDIANGESGDMSVGSVKDFSGNGRHNNFLISAQPTPGTGVVGGSYTFDGTDSILFNGTSYEDVCDNGCTFMFVGQRDGLGSMVGLSRFGTSGDNRFFQLGQESPNKALFNIYENGNSTACSVISGSGGFKSGFHMIVGTWDTSDNSARVYVDGELLETTVCPFDDINTTAWDDNEETRIGRDGSSSFNWEGEIDEVAIWNRTLSDSEIADLYGLKNDTTFYWNVNATDSNTTAFNGTWQFNTPVSPTDTCSYSSGNWNVECSDNCIINSDISLDSGSNITFNGSGNFIIDGAVISNFFKGIVQNLCKISLINGGNMSLS